jgi:hypothetical protein
LSISRKIASKCGLTASPSGESRTGRPRLNKGRPSSCSNRRIAAESDCWEIPQIAAAPVNVPASHTLRGNFLENRSGRTVPPSSSQPPQPAPKAFVEDNVRRAEAQALSAILSDERRWRCHYLYDDGLIKLSMQWGQPVCSANCHERGKCASAVWRPRFA